MKLVEFVLDLIFPKICQKCGAEESYLCLRCQSDIESPIMFCTVCDRPSTLGMTHSECLKKNTPLNSLMVVSRYEDSAIRNLVWQLKYNSAKSVSDDLSLLLTDFVVKNDLLDFFSDSVVTSVPLHKTRLKLRGYNQSELLAKSFGKKLKLPYVEPLEKSKKTTRQVDLEKNERITNVQGSFSLLKNTNLNKKVLLIDDIATTGSTLIECAKVLKQAGTEEVHALVLARNKKTL